MATNEYILPNTALTLNGYRLILRYDSDTHRISLVSWKDDKEIVSSLPIATYRDYVTLRKAFQFNLKHLCITLSVLFPAYQVTVGKSLWDRNLIRTTYTFSIGTLSFSLDMTQKREYITLRRFGFDLEITKDFLAFIPKSSSGIRYIDYAHILINGAGSGIKYRPTDPVWMIHNKILSLFDSGCINGGIIDNLFIYSCDIFPEINESDRYTSDGALKRRIVFDDAFSSPVSIPYGLKLQVLRSTQMWWHETLCRAQVRKIRIDDDYLRIGADLMNENVTPYSIDPLLTKALDLFYEFSFSS